MLAFERSWAEAVLEGFAPPVPGQGGPDRVLAPRPGEVNYLATFETMARAANALGRVGLRAALWMVATAPLWCRGHLRTVRGLDAQARAALLDHLLHHRSFVVRELTTMLKLVAAFALLGTPSVRARAGWEGQP